MQAGRSTLKKPTATTSTIPNKKQSQIAPLIRTTSPKKVTITTTSTTALSSNTRPSTKPGSKTEGRQARKSLYTNIDVSSFESKFPREKIREFKEAFIFYNISGNGYLTSDQLGKALRSLGFLVSSIEIIELVKGFGKKSFDLKDFLTAITKVSAKKEDPESLKHAIDGFKFDGKNIKVDEFKKIMTVFGDILTEEEVKFVFNDLSTLQAGKFDANELFEVLTLKKLPKKK